MVAISTTKLTQSEYDSLLYEEISAFEGKRYDAHIVKGIPHIGIGFNITFAPVFLAVLEGIGFDLENERDAYWADQLFVAVNKEKMGTDLFFVNPN